jgi:hypothetical protein
MTRTRRGKAAPSPATTVTGVSVWRATEAAHSVELNTRDDIAIDPDGVRWEVGDLPSGDPPTTIASNSRSVAYFVTQVVDEKRRRAYRAAKHRAVPIPKPKARVKRQPPRPSHAPVPCPLCRPHATLDHPGEPWPDCELCDGEGVVSAARAAAWRAEHDD